LNPLKLYRQFTQATADGLNAAGQTFVEDIQAQVPVRRGKLRAGYRVTRPAEPGKLAIKIGPSEKYGAKFYPWRSDKQAFGRRQAQRPARTRLFGGPEKVYQDRRAAVAKTEISKKIQEWANGK